MAYTPLNGTIFNAAYQGAVSGSFAGGRFPLNTNPAAPAQATLNAACFAFAKAYDTLRGASPATCCEVKLVQQASSGVWSTRVGRSAAQGDYTDLSRSVAAGIATSLALLASEGVACTCETEETQVFLSNPIQNAFPRVAGEGGYFGSHAGGFGFDPKNLTVHNGTLVIDVWCTGRLSGNEGVQPGNIQFQLALANILIGFPLTRLVQPGDRVGVGGTIVIPGTGPIDPVGVETYLAVDLFLSPNFSIEEDVDTCTVCVTEF